MNHVSTVTYEEMAERRLSSILEISREVSMQFKGHVVPIGVQHRWRNAKDYAVHINPERPEKRLKWTRGMERTAMSHD